VVDGATDAPVAGATVRVGPAVDVVPCTGLTDVAGRVVWTPLTCFNLQGPQTVTAWAYGYAATTWQGVAGANVTIPLTARAPATFATGTVTGTLRGVAPVATPGHRTALTVTSSGDRAAGALSSQAPLCETDVAPCVWQVEVPAGRRALAFLWWDVAEGPTGDVPTLAGVSLLRGLSVADGAILDGIDLAPPGSGTVAVWEGTLAAPPEALAVEAWVALELGEEGTIALPPQAIGAGAIRLVLPVLSSGDATVMVTFRADLPDGVSSSVVRRALVPGTPLVIDGWLPGPRNPVLQGRRVAWQDGGPSHAGEGLLLVSLEDAAGPVWEALLFPGATTTPGRLMLPRLSPDPLPGSGLALRVTTWDAPWSGTTFHRVSTGDALARWASATAAPTR